ncbi:15689_t:CDS:2, partial [Gigaspora rosea]
MSWARSDFAENKIQLHRKSHSVEKEGIDCWAKVEEKVEEIP